MRVVLCKVFGLDRPVQVGIYNLEIFEGRLWAHYDEGVCRMRLLVEEVLDYGIK